MPEWWLGVFQIADRSITVRIGADVKGLVSGFQTAKRSVQDFTGATDRIARAQRALADAALEAENAEKRLQSVMADSASTDAQKAAAAAKVEDSRERLTAATRKLADAEKSLGLGDWVTENEQSINTLSNAIGGVGLALTGVAALAVKKFADFDAAMSSVQASTMETASNMDLLRDAALDAGARTVYSATEAAAAIEELAKAGVSTADILGGGLDGALDLAAAGGIGVAEAAETAASAMTQFGLAGQDVTHIADLLAAGAGKAQGGVSDMSQALNQAGLVSSQMGLSIEETVGSLTAFASAGLTGSDAGTSFRAMLLRLANPTKESAQLMQELGIRAYDSQGAFVGMENLAAQLQRQLGGLTQETRNQALAQIFGQDAIRTSAILYEQGAEGIREWTAAVDEQGYAAEVAAARMDNLKGDIEGLMGSLETALIGMGEGANGPLRSLVQSLDDVVDAFGNLPAEAQQATLGIVGGGGLVALGVAGLGKLVVGINDARLAMQQLGISAKTAGKLVGGIGVALGVATYLVMDWAESQAEAKRRAEELAETLDQVTGATTKSTEAFVADELVKSGAAKAYKILGGDVRDLVDAAMGAEDALTRVNAIVDEATDEAAWNTIFGKIENVGYDPTKSIREGLSEMQGALKAGTTEWQLMQEATEGAGAAQDRLGPMYGATTGAIEEQTDALQVMIDAQREAAGEVLSLRDAQRGLESAYDAATDALNKNGPTLDITTEKGRANQAALDDIADSTWDLIDSMKATGSSSADLQSAMETNRAKFIAAAESMGMATGDAEALANQLGLIPGSVKAQVIVDTDEGKRAADSFIAAYSGRTIPLILKMSLDQGGFNAAQAAAYSAARSASYATGGYTGDGGKYEPAGVVHKGEYVINAAQTAKHRGLLEAINRGMPGYALGGMVGSSGPSTLSLPTDGWSISGSLNIGGALVPLVDARISAAQQSRTAMTRQGVRR